MGKQVVGLKVGASSLAAARVEMNGSAELVQLARESLPGGVVVGGEIRDVPMLAAALKEFFARHKLPTRAVRVGIANNRIGVRTIDLAGIGDPKQLANAVRFRAQEALPIPLDEAVLDYHVLSEGMDGEGQPTKRVLLVVAYRDLIDTYVAACREAGLRLVGIDLEAFALLRALTPSDAPVLTNGERSALVAVSVGADRTTLAVSDGLTCEFTRVLAWGGASLTGALARLLEIEPDEAERIKKEIALEGTQVPEGLDEERAARAREALRTGLTTFARELVSSLQFYQGQPDSLGIREIVLAGGTAELRGLADALQSLIGVNVRVGDPLTGVTAAKKIKELPTPAYTIPIGLGLGA